jgi:hypothetical protein
VGKKHGDKQKNTPKSERRERLLDVVETIEDDARASFDLAFEQLEQKAAQKLDKIVSRTRRRRRSAGCPMLVEQADVIAHRPRGGGGRQPHRPRFEETPPRSRTIVGDARAVRRHRAAYGSPSEHPRHWLEEVGRPGVGRLGTTRGPPATTRKLFTLARARASRSRPASRRGERSGCRDRDRGARDLIAIANARRQEPSSPCPGRRGVRLAGAGDAGGRPSRASAPTAHADAETEEWQAPGNRRSWSTVSPNDAPPVSVAQARSRRSASCASWSGCGPRWRGSRGRGAAVAPGDVDELDDAVEAAVSVQRWRRSRNRRSVRCASRWSVRAHGAG